MKRQPSTVVREESELITRLRVRVNPWTTDSVRKSGFESRPLWMGNVDCLVALYVSTSALLMVTVRWLSL